MKKLYIIAVVLIALFTVCSCSGGGQDIPDESTAEEISYTQPSIKDYAVLRAEKADAYLVTIASNIRTALETASGEHITIAYAEDLELRDDVGGKSFILVGDTLCTYTAEDGTLHNYTDEAKASMGDNDYVIQAFEDGTVAIVAESEKAFELAFEKFTADLIGQSTLTLSSSTDKYTGHYDAPPRYEYKYDTDLIEIADDCPTDMPVLYIITENETRPSQVPHDTYITATFALDGMGFIDDVPEMSGQIKGRGNYSWSFPKKPYNIKFDEKVSLGGLGAAKKWTLVTTYSDKTMTRNYIALTLGLDLGMDYSTECFYVNVYFNGEFRGVYLLTERVQIQKQRVDIDVEKGAGLFEIEMTYRHSETKTHMTLGSGVHLMLREPDPTDSDDEYSDEQITEMFAEYKKIFKRADSALSRGYEEYSSLINIDSFINWYIVNEFVKNYDSQFVTSCFCFIDNEGVIWMGPPWDYDTCMGNQNAATCMDPEGWHVANAGWYTILLQDEDFWRLLCERWAEIRDEGIILDDYIAKIDNFVADHTESIEANYERWPDCLKSSDLRGQFSTYTYEDEVEYLENWLTVRTAWLDEQFGYGE